MTNADGEAWFRGYVGMSSGDGHIVIAGADSDGNHFVLDNGSVLGLLADGNVLMGNPTRWYTYDYDKDGNFVGLTDGDGNNYSVETAGDGSTTITDAAGDIGDFNADGSYDIKDPAGDVLDQGALFGENDGDPIATPDANSGDEPAATVAPDNSADASSVGDNIAATESSDANTGDTSGGDNGSGG
jgi:hypothetical protein